MTAHDPINKSALLKEEKWRNSKTKGKWSNSHKKENSFLNTSKQKPYAKVNDFASLFMKGASSGIGVYNPKQRKNSKHN